MQYANEEKYQGNWNQGKREGKGTVLREDGRVKFKGDWRNDQMVLLFD